MGEQERAAGGFKGSIFLVGFMGTGKSTVAVRLADRLSIRRLEMDEKIEESTGMAISEIFDEYGEDYFRGLETELLISLGRQEPAVVSCGGGVVVRPENIGHMKKNGRVVWLTALPETVYERVKDSANRPVLNGNMNVEFIAGLMEKRREKYEAAADLTVATDGKTAEEIAGEILLKLSGQASEEREGQL